MIDSKSLPIIEINKNVTSNRNSIQKLIKNKQSRCKCKRDIIFCSDLCIKCLNDRYTDSFDPLKNTDIPHPFDLYIAIDQTDSKIEHFQILNDVYTLKRKLLLIIKNISNFNKIIESKCKCGTVHPRCLEYGSNEHQLFCKNCGLFCSNCLSDSHLTEWRSISCLEYKKLVDIYNDCFIQSWKSAFLNSDEMHSIIVESMKSAIKEKNSFNHSLPNRQGVHLDLNPKKRAKIKPNPEKEWVKKMINDNITTGIEKNNKSSSDSMDSKCSNENMTESKRFDNKNIETGISKISTFQRIFLKEEVEKKVAHTPLDIGKKNIYDGTRSMLLTEPYFCCICENMTTCMGVVCLKSDCEFKFNKICGDCITKKNCLTEKRMTITIIDGKGILRLFEKDYDGVYKGSIGFSDGSYVQPSHLEWSDEYEQWQIHTDYNGLQEDSNMKKLIYGRIVGLNKNMINCLDQVTFRWCSLSSTQTNTNSRTTACIVELIETTAKVKNSNVLRRYSCLESNHILEFPDMIALYNRFQNMKEYKHREQAINKINCFGKSIFLFKKWKRLSRELAVKTTAIKIIKDKMREHHEYMNMLRSKATIINLVAKRFILKKKIEKATAANKIYRVAKLFIFNRKRDLAATIINRNINRYLILKRWKKLITDLKNINFVEEIRTDLEVCPNYLEIVDCSGVYDKVFQNIQLVSSE